MNATTRRLNPLLLRLAAAALSATSAPTLLAAGSKNPVGKLYVAILGGAANLVGSERITDLKKKTAHPVNETVLETKKNNGQDNAGGDQPDYSAMVFSNGTGMYVDPDTRLKVQKFEQEPFTPNRTDMDIEPSISHTQTMLEQGTVGLCTPKMSLGSTMQYLTPLGSINVRARRIVIESFDDYTRVAVIEGESTVRGGDGNAVDLGGQVIKAGQQAYIRKSSAGQPPIVQIEPISERMMSQLDDKVAMACVAKKSVYFEAVDRTVGSGAEGADNLVAGAGENQETGGGGVSAFDDAPVQELVPVEVVPVKLPVEFTVSPARVVK
jgi:hypothetical protein